MRPFEMGDAPLAFEGAYGRMNINRPIEIRVANPCFISSICIIRFCRLILPFACIVILEISWSSATLYLFLLSWLKVLFLFGDLKY